MQKTFLSISGIQREFKGRARRNPRGNSRGSPHESPRGESKGTERTNESKREKDAIGERRRRRELTASDRRSDVWKM
jgi:hypothetical protein